MKFRYLFLICFCFFGRNAAAQQNFFNVPSSDLTEKHKIYLQQQISFFPKTISGNTTFCYGLDNNFEIGANLSGLTFDYEQHKLISNNSNEQPVFPSFGINMQKQLIASGWYSFSAGGQMLLPNEIANMEYYLYLNNNFEYKHLKLVAGLFGGNDFYFGKESRLGHHLHEIGIQLGMEYQLIEDKLYFQTDFMSGSTPLSNLIIGSACKVSNHLMLSAGYQLPNQKKTSSNGAILGLSYVQ